MEVPVASFVRAMNLPAVESTLQHYYKAFAATDPATRLELLQLSMTPGAEIWGPQQGFRGYEGIAAKIAGFQQRMPGCRLVRTSGLYRFETLVRLRGAILNPDGSRRAGGEALMLLAADGRIERVFPFWDELPPLPEGWAGQA